MRFYKWSSRKNSWNLFLYSIGLQRFEISIVDVILGYRNMKWSQLMRTANSAEKMIENRILLE
jgi:hypothetical protein